MCRICSQISFCSYAWPAQPGPNRTRLCGPCIVAIAGDLALLFSDSVIKLVSVLFGKCTTLVVTKC